MKRLYLKLLLVYLYLKDKIKSKFSDDKNKFIY